MGSASRRGFLLATFGAIVSACRAASGVRSASTTTTADESMAGPPTTTARTAATTTTPTPATPATLPPRRVVEVICRDAWGAAQPVGSAPEHTITRITVHHTAVPLEANRDAPGRLRGHQQYHQSLGWSDLAYHHMIDADGNVYEGRPLDRRGDTGTTYDPTGHHLVCLEGDFDTQTVPDAQWTALIDVVAWSVASFGVEPASIAGHTDHAPETTCPGSDVQRRINSGELQDEVGDMRAHVDLVVVCGESGLARVASIEAGSEASPSAGA